MSETTEPDVYTIRTLSFLTGDGDTTYGWESADDPWVLPMIQAKIDAGYVFWIVKRNPLREVKLRLAAEAKSARSILIKDDDARILFEQGRIGLMAQSVAQRSEELVSERRARSAEEVVSHDTLAHRPMRGG